MTNEYFFFGDNAKQYELTINDKTIVYRLSSPFYIEILQGSQYANIIKEFSDEILKSVKTTFGSTLYQYADVAGEHVGADKAIRGISIKPKNETKMGFREYFLCLLNIPKAQVDGVLNAMKIAEILSAVHNRFTDISSVNTWSCFSNLVYDISDVSCIMHKSNTDKTIVKMDYSKTAIEGYIPVFIDNEQNVWYISKQFLGADGLCPF